MTAVPATNLDKWNDRVGDPLKPLSEHELRQLVRDVSPLLKDPEHAADAHLILGLGYMGVDKGDERAASHLRAAMRLNKHDWTAAYNLSTILMDMRTQQAAAEAESIARAILERPDGRRPHVLIVLATLLMARGQPAEAMDIYMEAVRRCVDDEPMMYLRMVPIALQWGMAIECVEIFARWALVSNPDLSPDAPAIELLKSIPRDLLFHEKLDGIGTTLAYVALLHPTTPASPLLGPRPRRGASTVHDGGVSPVAQEESRKPSVDQVVADRLRSLAAGLPGVSAAYISPDAHHFVITGSDWNEVLDEAPATLATELTFDVFPNEPTFDGYYQQGMEQAPEGWKRVFP